MLPRSSISRAIGPIGLLAATICAPMPSLAATLTQSVQIRIVIPLKVVEIDTLDFGGVFAAAPGSVTIDPATGARTAAGAGQLLSPTYSMGVFVVTGQANAPVSVTLPTGDIMLSNGANSMRMHSMVHSVVGGASALDALGQMSFRVGATVDIAGTEPEGSYSGTYDVTVNYQ